jgi:predicted RNA-binding Zn ribbon-like protein
VPGNLGLDFANTAEWHAGPAPTERLTSYARAVAWAREHGILSEQQAAAVLEKAAGDPKAGGDALARVIDMREAVYRVLSSVAHDQAPADSDLQVVAQAAREAATHLKLIQVPAPGSLPRFAWIWSGLEDELTGLLWPVAKAVTELLISGQLSQLRQCAGDPCGWLFLDQSKNGSRRWCDMADCGNRAKARRYRERKKGAVSAPGPPGAAGAAEP